MFGTLASYRVSNRPLAPVFVTATATVTATAIDSINFLEKYELFND